MHSGDKQGTESVRNRKRGECEGGCPRRRFLPATRILAFLGGGFVIIFALLWIFHTENTTITLPASLNRSELKMSLRAYSAERAADKFYEVDLTAKYQDGELRAAWEIPSEWRDRDAYIEIVAAEELAEDEVYDSSCAYFVPVYARGFVSDVLNWNKLDERQRVGCVEAENEEYDSYIAALGDVQGWLYEGIVVDGGGVLVPDTSGDGGVSVQDVTNIVNQIIDDKVSVFVGPQGATGAKGDKGEDGKGEDGKDGADGKDGVDGQDGDDGVAAVTGGGLVLHNHTLSLRTCADGEILKVVNGIWECAADDTGAGNGADNDTQYSAGDGLKLDKTNGNVFSIDAAACMAGQYLTWNGTSFACATDKDTTTTDTDTKYGALANGGLTLDGNNDFALMTCADDQILRWVGANGRWECSADKDTTYDLSGYLQIANLQGEIDKLTPGYYNKTQIDAMLNNLVTTIPAGGLHIPQEEDKESDLTVASCSSAGDYWFVQDMDVSKSGHTGRVWCYEDSNGDMQLYRVYDEYLTADNVSIAMSNGVMSVSQSWLDGVLAGKSYATGQDVNDAIDAIDFTPYVAWSQVPQCSAGSVLTSTAAGALSCVAVSATDNDTKYQAGDGLKLTVSGGNNVFAVDAAACMVGQYLTWNGASFACADDKDTITVDTDTQYFAKTGGGLLLDGTTKEFALQTCADKQTLVYNGTAAAWECVNLPSGTADLPDGTADGQVLYWDSTSSSWKLSGTGGAEQKLDDVTATDVKIDNGLDLTAASGGIKDYYGNSGAAGDRLTIDQFGNLKWAPDETCQKIVQPMGMYTAATSSETTARAMYMHFGRAIGNYFYGFSGYAGGTVYEEAYKYDMNNGGAKTQIASYPVGAVQALAVETDGTYLYTFGGLSGSTIRNSAYRYDPTTDTYTQLANVPTTIYGSDTVYYNGKIYLFSGRTTAGGNAGNTRSVYIYDIASDSWTTQANVLPVGLAYANTQLVGNTVYVMGGLNTNASNTQVDTVYAVDLSQTTLVAAAKADMPGVRVDGGTTYHDGKIYYVGGSENGTAKNTIFVYDVAGDTWTTATTPANLPAKYHFGFTTYKNTMWMFAGFTGSANLDTINTLTFNDGTLWTLAANDRYMLPADTVASKDVTDYVNGTTIAAGFTIPANTEVLIAADNTEIKIMEDIPDDSGWVRRSAYCDGGSGGGTSPLPDGTSAGQMLYWDGSAWVLSGAGGNQTLDFVTVQNDLVVDGKLTPNGGIVDAYGKTGKYGEILAIDINGNLKWSEPSTCQTVVEPTPKPYDYFPTMTSDTAPAPFVAKASSYNVVAERPASAFDDNASTYWHVAGPPGQLPATLQIGNSRTAYEVSSYAITSRAGYGTQSPSAWTLEGSNDDSNWTVLDTQTGIAWTAAQATKNFTLSTPARYKYFRLQMTANAGYAGGWTNALSVAELAFSGTPNTPEPIWTLKQNDRYVVPADTKASKDVEDVMNGGTIVAGTTIPANTEVRVMTDGTEITLLQDITDSTGWVRRAEYCGAGGGSEYFAGSGITIDGQNNISLADGTTAGQMMYWNGTSWELTGNGGNQTLDFVEVKGGLDLTAAGGGLKDYYGNMGKVGEVLAVDSYGNLKWSEPQTCQSTIEPSSVLSQPYFPLMTSNNSPAPFVAYASSNYSGGGYEAWRLFDDNQSTVYHSADPSTYPNIISIGSSNEAYEVASYSITTRNDGQDVSAATAEAPRNWTLEASNDNSSWTAVDTQTGVTSWTAKGQTKTFTLGAPVKYKYYRLNITANNGFARNLLSFSEWKLMGAPNDVVLLTLKSGDRYTVPADTRANFDVKNFDTNAVIAAGTTIPAGTTVHIGTDNTEIYLLENLTENTGWVRRAELCGDSTGTNLPDGTAVGQMLYWDGSAWQLSGSGGAQTLDFVSATEVTAGTVVVSDMLDMTAANGGLKDYYGNTGKAGERLTIDATGYLRWMADETCQATVPVTKMVNYQAMGTTTPIAYRRAAYATVGSDLYTFGGLTTTQVANSYKYNLTNGTSTAITNYAGGGFSDGIAASDGTYVYIFGGSNNGIATLSTAYRYDPATNTYTKLANMPQTLATTEGVYYNGKIYMIGGSTTITTPTAKSRNMVIYDIASDSYTTVVNVLPAALSDMNVLLVGSTMYVINGMQTSNTRANTLYAIDLSQPTLTATALATSPIAESDMASSYQNGKIYVLNGGQADTASEYDIASDTWRAISGTGMPLWQHMLYGTVDNKLWLFSGWNGSSNINRIARVTFDAHLFTLATDDRYIIPADSVANKDVTEYIGGTVIAAGNTIPKNTEILVTADDTEITLLEDVNDTTGWVRRIKYCNGGNGVGLPDGARAGQALVWDGTDWVAGEAISIDVATTNALNIRSGTGEVVFNVDTVNNQVAIGNGANVDQIAFGLTLDTFGDGTATDPSTLAINGTMYYNSDMGKFRCYENGAWKDCIGGGSGSSITVNYIPPDSTGNIAVGANDVGAYTKEETDQKIDEELTFEYLHAPINLVDMQNGGTARPVAYLKVGEKYNLTASTYTDVNVKDSAGNTIAAGAIIPAGTEVVAQQDTRVYLNEDLTIEGSWVRRGGAGGPIQIGVITPTTWTDDVVKKNGEVWLKMNGQTVDSSLYPALNDSSLAIGYTDVTPTMTSNTAPAPYVASASSSWNATYAAWKAFNKVIANGDYWQTPNQAMAPDGATNPQWLMLDFGGSVTADTVDLAMSGPINGAPEDFVVEVSGDGTNWTTVKSVVGETYFNVVQSPARTKRYAFDARQTFRYIRLTITKVGAGSGSEYAPMVSEMRVLDSSTITLPNYGATVGGQYYYIKAAGYTNNGYTISDGTAGGQVLEWDDVLGQWVAGSASGGGGQAYLAGNGINLDVATNTFSLAYVDGTSGDFAFKNAVGDTATTFRIADSADAPIFNVDTASGIISIGSGAANDGTAVALLLDSSTVAPTNPQNGMMYYDTSLGKFRCYEGDKWKDCIYSGVAAVTDEVLIAGEITDFSARTANTWVSYNLSANNGDTTLLSGNTITISEAGYYVVSMTGGIQSANTVGRKLSGISVNGGTALGVSTLEDTSGHIASATITYRFAVGDKVQFMANQNDFGNITTVPQWSIIRQGNVDNFADRPDLWTVGTEYDFGGGVYGQRFAGTFAQGANAYAITKLSAKYDPAPVLVSYGGYVGQNNNVMQNQVGGVRLGPSNANYQSNSINVEGGTIILFTYDNTAGAANKYDIWVKYRK